MDGRIFEHKLKLFIIHELHRILTVASILSWGRFYGLPEEYLVDAWCPVLLTILGGVMTLRPLFFELSCILCYSNITLLLHRTPYWYFRRSWGRTVMISNCCTDGCLWFFVEFCFAFFGFVLEISGCFIFGCLCEGFMGILLLGSNDSGYFVGINVTGLFCVFIIVIVYPLYWVFKIAVTMFFFFYNLLQYYRK